MKNIIELNQVSKKYPTFQLANIDFSVPAGSIVGLLGENGAGKTTLIKLILSLLQKDSGTIQIFDHDISEEKNLPKEKIGVVLDNSFFSETLNAHQIESILKELYQKNWDTKLYHQYLQRFQIPEKQKIKTFSKGMKKKLEIATALAHHPNLLILDEATSGLDPVVRSEILDIFQEFIANEENSILISTHITSDLEHIADYIAVLHKGKMLLKEEKDTLQENYGILKCSAEDFEKIKKEKSILRYRKMPYSYEVLVNDKKMWKRKEYVVDKPSLDDLMVMMIKGECVCGD